MKTEYASQAVSWLLCTFKYIHNYTAVIEKDEDDQFLEIGMNWPLFLYGYYYGLLSPSYMLGDEDNS